MRAAFAARYVIFFSFSKLKKKHTLIDHFARNVEEVLTMVDSLLGVRKRRLFVWDAKREG